MPICAHNSAPGQCCARMFPGRKSLAVLNTLRPHSRPTASLQRGHAARNLVGSEQLRLSVVRMKGKIRAVTVVVKF